MLATSFGRRRRRSTPRSSSTRSRARGSDTAQARSPHDPGKDTRRTDFMSTNAIDENALTARNRSVEIEGARLVYRRLGNAESQAPPLLCLQHFRGNLDNWDPALVDRIAREREVILLDNRGVGASTGTVPDNVED